MRPGSTSHNPDWQTLQLAELDPELLRRYWLGDASPSDIEQIDAWFSAKAGRREWYEQLRYGLAAGPLTDLSFSETVRRTSGVLHAIKLQPTRGAFKAQPLRRSMWPWLATAIAVTLMMVVGWHTMLHRHGREALVVTTYTTERAQRANITLSDGSTVALNVASRLDVPVDYGSGNHVLRLRGEALFTVSHHEDTPLTVITGGTTVRVLGTSFVVRCYATDSTATIAVRDGKVAVHSSAIIAGQQVQAMGEHVVSTRTADPSFFSFATGVLTLNGIPLPQAISELDRWYDVDIRLGDPSLAARSINGRLAAGSVTDLTTLLKMTYGVRVVRDGRVLTLFPQ